MIVWGKSAVVQDLGFVADACPICKQVRACLLRSVGTREHLYFITVGSVVIWKHVARCETCGREFDVEAAFYTGMAGRMADLPSLIKTTNPENSPGAVRLRQVIEPFLYFNRLLLERTQKGTQVDGMSGLGCLGILVFLLVPPIVVFPAFSNQPPEWATNLWIATFLLSIGFFVYTFVTERGRFIRRKLVPALAERLSGVNANVQEIRAAMERLKLHKYPISKLVEFDQLAAEQPKRSASPHGS